MGKQADDRCDHHRPVRAHTLDWLIPRRPRYSHRFQVQLDEDGDRLNVGDTCEVMASMVPVGVRVLVGELTKAADASRVLRHIADWIDRPDRVCNCGCMLAPDVESLIPGRFHVLGLCPL